MLSRNPSQLLSIAAAASTLCAVAATAHAGAVSADPNCLTTTIPPNDDDYTGPVALGFDILLGADFHSQLFISTNGHLRFTPAGPTGWFSLRNWEAFGIPVIAPFFGDVDTRGAGSGQVTYGATTFFGRPALCINWVDVGYYDSHVDKRNSFQVLLVDRGDVGPGDFDMIFDYDRVEWESSDGMPGSTGGIGGTLPPRVGYFDGTTSVELPGSLTLNLRDGQSQALIAGSQGTALAGRYVFPIRNGLPLSTAIVEGYVFDPNGAVAPGAPVQACTTCGGTPVCVFGTSDTDGHYELTAFDPADIAACSSWDVSVAPPAGTAFLAPPAESIALTSTDTIVSDLDLHLDAPVGMPADTTIEPSQQTTVSGTPVVYWQSPLTLQTQGCPSSFFVDTVATYQITQGSTVVTSGFMDELPPGVFTAAIDPLFPTHGNITITMSLVCPDGTTGSYGFSVYIDPSGNVYTTDGMPVAGARMTLYRAENPAGPFEVVSDGSAIMSPSNRANPSYTDNEGHFGWDVVGGFYVVRADKPGCTSPDDPQVPYVETDVLPVPPEWTDLVMVLSCPRLLPTVIDSVFPPGDSVGVGVNEPLVIRLNKAAAVDAWTTRMALHRASDGALVQDFPVQPSHLVDPYTVELWPTWPLEPYTEYYVVIYRKAVRIAEAPWGYIGDYSQYPGGDAVDPAMWHFTTGAGFDPAPLPRVISGVVPLDGAIDVPVDTHLEIYLDAPVAFDQWTTHLSVHRADDGSLVEQIPLGWMHLVDPQTLIVELASPLQPDTAYYVVFDRKAMRIDEAPWGYLGDRSGYVDGMPINPMMWTFRTQP